MFRIKLLVTLLLLLSSQAWATTYYVRPTAQGAGDGLAYATAASPTTIDYTAMIASDTVKVCGAFVAANKDTRKGGAAMMSVTAHSVIVDGDCSASGDLAQATMDGGSTVPYGVYCETMAECQGQTWKNIKVTNFPNRGFYIRNTLTDTDSVGFTGTNLRCEDIIGAEVDAPWCVGGWGADATLTYIYSARSTDDALHWQGNQFTLRNWDFRYPGYGIASGSFVGDCVQVITQTDNPIVTDGYCDKRNANADGNVSKQAVIIGDPCSGSGTYGEVSRIVAFFPTSGNSVFETKPIYNCENNIKIQGNYIEGGYYGIFAFGQGQLIESNIVKDTEYRGIDVPTTTAGGTSNVRQNTVDGSAICYEFKSTGAGTTINAYNNLAMNCGTYGFEKAFATYTQSNNRCDLATPTCSNNAGTIASEDPLLVGGTSPTNAAGFKLKAGSALRRAGKSLNIGAVKDHSGRAFHSPPSIGAYEVTSGHDASTRTTATERTLRN